MEGVGIGLVHQVPGPGDDGVLVDVVLFHARMNSSQMEGAVGLFHGVAARFPAVKSPTTLTAVAWGGPQAEHDALFPALLFQVGTKEALGLKVVAPVCTGTQAGSSGLGLPSAAVFLRPAAVLPDPSLRCLFQFIGLFHILCSSSLAQTDASPHILRDKQTSERRVRIRRRGPRLSLHYYINNSRGFFKAFFIKSAIIFSFKNPEIGRTYKF